MSSSGRRSREDVDVTTVEGRKERVELIKETSFEVTEKDRKAWKLE